eukprot:21058_2
MTVPIFQAKSRFAPVGSKAEEKKREQGTSTGIIMGDCIARSQRHRIHPRVRERKPNPKDGIILWETTSKYRATRKKKTSPFVENRPVIQPKAPALSRPHTS